MAVKQGGRKRSSGTRRSGSGRKASGGRRASRTKRPPTDHQEIEWQFDATELERVEGWLGDHSSGSGLVVAPESTDEISDTYYDTEDWRFYRAGYALRVRKAGNDVEATMKSLTPAEGNVRRRREITEPLGDDKPDTLGKAPGPVGERARSLIGDHELRPIFGLRTRRQKFALLLGDTAKDPDNGTGDGTGDREDTPGSVRIGEVLLDASEIPLGEGEEPARMRRVEVEAGVGTAPTPDLRGFVDEMQFALDLRPTSVSKYEAGLYATGLSPDGTVDVGLTQIDPSMSVGEVAFAVLRGQFAALGAHEPGTRLGEDPEELHDMRVATRRMRAAIKVFEGVLPERAKWFREELRWLATALGDVRDLDVQMERLQAWRREADEEGAEFLDRILDLMGKRRAESRERLLAALDSGRYGRFQSSFAEMLRRGPGAGRELSRTDGRGPAGEPITTAAPALVSRPYRKWRQDAKRLDESSPPDDFHELRKKGKRLRYTLEFVSDVYGEATGKLVKPLKALQDDLGRHQDAVVAAEYLRVLGTATDGPRVPRGAAFTMGVYAERYLREAAEARASALSSEPFRALTKGKAWKAFEKVMEDAAGGRGKAKGKGSKKAGR